jgi:DNA-binding transcriptional regulator YhcF (GntR family)
VRQVRINETSGEYPYVQLAAILRQQIASGQIRDRVPSLTQLAREHDVALNTVQRAFRILKDEGLIYAVPGRGTFVRRDA